MAWFAPQGRLFKRMPQWSVVLHSRPISNLPGMTPTRAGHGTGYKADHGCYLAPLEEEV